METTDSCKVDCSLAIGLQTCLGQRWTHDDFSDFTVVVEDTEFECHRFLLASCSSFFSLLLRSDMKENFENKVTLNNISKETFGVILNCIYKGEDGFTLDNILDVWHAAHMLDFKYLIQSCENFICSNLNVDNYISFYYHSQFLDSQAVTSKVHTFILQNFDHFMTTQTFLELPFEDTHTLLKSTDLNVTSENVVVDAILKWVNFETENVSEIKEKTITNATQKITFMIPDLENTSDTQAVSDRNENTSDTQAVSDRNENNSDTQAVSDKNENTSHTQAVSDRNENTSDTQSASDRNENTSDTQAVSDRNENTSDTQAVSDRNENTSDTQSVSDRNENTSDTQAVSDRNENTSDTQSVSDRNENTSDTQSASDRNENTSDTQSVSDRNENSSNTQAVSDRNENTSDTQTVSDRNENTSDTQAVSDRNENTSDTQAVSDRNENFSDIQAVSDRNENTSDTQAVSDRNENSSDTQSVFDRNENSSDTQSVSDRNENTSDTQAVSNRNENTSDTQAVSYRNENTCDIQAVSDRNENTSDTQAVSDRNENTSDTQAVSYRNENTCDIQAVSDRNENTSDTQAVSDRNENTSDTQAVSDRNENTSDTQAVSDRNENTSDTQAVSDRNENTSVTQAVSDRNEYTSDTQAVSDRNEKNSDTQAVSDRNENTSDTQSVSDKNENTSDTQSVSDRNENTSDTQSASDRNENTSDTQYFSDRNENTSDTQSVSDRNENDLGGIENRNFKERKTCLPVLLSSARLCLCSEKYLEQFLLNPVITSDKDALMLVKDALLYHWNPQRSSHGLINYRGCHGMCNVMAFISEKQLYFYLLDRKQCVMVMDLEADYENIAACKTTLLLHAKRREEQADSRLWYDCFDILDGCKEIKKDIIKIKLLDRLFFLYHHDYFILICNDFDNQKIQCELKTRKRLGMLTIASHQRPYYALIHEDNILVFVFSYPVTRIKVYSLDTLQLIVEKSLDLDGLPNSMASFRHKESSYFLQSSGRLWLIVDKGEDINFVNVTTLWNFKWNLRGAVCYLDELFVFGNYNGCSEDEWITSSSLPGVFNSINAVEHEYMSNAVFLIIPKEEYKEFI